MIYDYLSLIESSHDNVMLWRDNPLERIINYFDGADLFVVAAREADMNGIWRKQFGGALGPFDDGDAVGFEIFVEAEVVGFLRAAEAVEVDVMKRDGSLIFANEGVGWTADGLGDTRGLGQPLREAGFTRAEVAVQCDDDRGGGASTLFIFQ